MEKDLWELEIVGETLKRGDLERSIPQFREQPSTNHDLTQKLCRCKTDPKTHTAKALLKSDHNINTTRSAT